MGFRSEQWVQECRLERVDFRMGQWRTRILHQPPAERVYQRRPAPFAGLEGIVQGLLLYLGPNQHPQEGRRADIQPALRPRRIPGEVPNLARRLGGDLEEAA